MKETRYTKTLYKAIRKLNLNQEELKGTLLCLYINGCSSEDCARLFETNKEKVVKFLEFEELYHYLACSKCGRLRNRGDGFRQRKNRRDMVCLICKKEYQDKHRSEYNRKNKEKIRKQKKKYMKMYYKNNRKERKQYNVNSKEKRKEYRKEYNQRNASIELVQKLDMFEEVSGNQIRCKYCGRWMIPTISQVYNRLQGVNIYDNHYIYCSEKCKEECPTYNKILYPKGFKQASSREVNPVLRQLVLKRDNYICQKCGKSQDELTVGLHCHHVTPAVNSPIEANDPDNCITLCKDCHKEVHKIPGCGFAELKCT